MGRVVYYLVVDGARGGVNLALISPSETERINSPLCLADRDLMKSCEEAP
jgi:hypothetical protein